MRRRRSLAWQQDDHLDTPTFRGLPADSSSDSNTGGSRRLWAAGGVQGIQVADGSKRL
jgi:hypothetical protein